MAQVRALDVAWAGDFKFVNALAKAFAGKILARISCVARRRGSFCIAATALVSRLVSVVIAIGILFQPVHRPLRAAVVFHFHRDAAGICAAARGQGFIAT